jgi:hypothetical protein
MNGFQDPATVALRFGGRSGEQTDDQRATIACINARIAFFVAKGWSYRAWRPTSPGSPCVERTSWGGGSYMAFADEMTPGWMDHLYRLIRPDKRVVYVSEPYGVDGAVLARLVTTLGDDWCVRLRPEVALHYPGHTLAIWIERKGIVA